MAELVVGLDEMRAAGKLAAATLDYIEPFVEAGVSTKELDRLCEEYMRDHGAIPACIGYKGYPNATCISVNHVVCHGIPSEKKILHDGDILNIDVTVILDGWHGDTSRMYSVGNVARRAQLIIDACYCSMMAGIAAVKDRSTTGDVGAATVETANMWGFSVIPTFCGHGIGKVFHDDPQVPFKGAPGSGSVLKTGMFITVEPMLSAGKTEVKTLNDEWTVVTRDRSLSAQFEHTVAVLDNGFEILTKSGVK